ncbi:hypothetical protein MPER_13045, partial [Moniliophthora perniciosa FA553]
YWGILQKPATLTPASPPKPYSAATVPPVPLLPLINYPFVLSPFFTEHHLAALVVVNDHRTHFQYAYSEGSALFVWPSSRVASLNLARLGLVLIDALMPKETTKAKRKAAVKAEKAPRKPKKDPNAPKRALSAYMFFSQDWRDRIKTENPDASFGKLLGAKWKELDEEEKKPYVEQAAKDKERAEGEKIAYDSGKKSAENSDKDDGEVKDDDDDDE